METLYDLFREKPEGPVLFQGHEVVRAIQTPITSERELLIAVESFTESPRQAIRVSAKNCKIDVGYAVNITDPVLWADKCQREEGVLLKIHSAKSGARVILYNAWQGRSGSLDGWLMEAGMIAEPAGDGKIRVQCSDGIGPTDFSSLIFRYEWSSL